MRILNEYSTPLTHESITNLVKVLEPSKMKVLEYFETAPIVNLNQYMV